MTPVATLQSFSTSLMKMLSEDRARFQQAVGRRAVADWPNPDFQEALSFLLSLHELSPALSGWNFLIIHSEQIVGEIGAKHLPDRDGAVEVGYGIAASHRRRGVASAALRGFIDFAFQQPGVRQITATCLTTNQGSIALLQKLGFACTGEHDSEDGMLFSWRLPRR